MEMKTGSCVATNRTSRVDERYTNNDQHGVDVSTNNSLYIRCTVPADLFRVIKCASAVTTK